VDFHFIPDLSLFAPALNLIFCSCYLTLQN